MWLIKSNLITHSSPNVDPTALDNAYNYMVNFLPYFLTDWAIHVTNEAIWQCNGLELDAMDPLVAIIHHSLSLEIGLTVPSMNSKQLSEAAPFAEIA